jgi:hypothetical protein
MVARTARLHRALRSHRVQRGGSVAP